MKLPRDLSGPEVVRLTLESDRLQGGSIIDLHDGGEMEDDATRLSRPQPLLDRDDDVCDVEASAEEYTIDRR